MCPQRCEYRTSRKPKSERICGAQDVIEQREGRFNLEVMGTEKTELRYHTSSQLGELVRELREDRRSYFGLVDQPVKRKPCPLVKPEFLE